MPRQLRSLSLSASLPGRRRYEVTAELEWKAESESASEDEKAKLCKGTLHLYDVAPSGSAGTVEMGSAVTKFKTTPKEAADKPRVDAALEALKQDLASRLGEFDAEYRASKRI